MLQLVALALICLPGLAVFCLPLGVVLLKRLEGARASRALPAGPKPAQR